MSRGPRFIGVDPGPMPGIAVLEYDDHGRLRKSEALQCSASLAPLFVSTLISGRRALTVVQVERFVVGRRSARSSSAAAGETTRDLVGAINEVVLGTDARIYQRTAAQVKPWATDERLEAAGLLAATKGMRHARDAARHALYAAVRTGVPDPLSKAAHR